MSVNYNLFFYANVCHVCKRFGDGIHLKRCGNCNMIAYCGKTHQKMHWSEHKDTCMAIQKVFNMMEQRHSSEISNITLNQWVQKKINLMVLVTLNVGRHLKHYEEQMFKFPRACIVCHEQNRQVLEDCQNCASVSFCMAHKSNQKHINICHLFKQCLNLDILTMHNKHMISNLCFIQDVSDKQSYMDMNDFIKIYINTQHLVQFQQEYIALHSDHLTRPLTLIYGMQLLNYSSKYKTLIVHIIAANIMELVNLEVWEIVLHILPVVTSIKIIMIGPELLKGSFTQDLCNNCVSLNNELLFEFHDMLYNNYLNSPLATKPNVVIGYNTGIHECENLNSFMDTWTLSIQSLAKENCPFILSCYTQEEAEKDKARINTILNSETEYMHCGKNPFASLRPNRDYANEDVFYQNNYVIIYRNLFPKTIKNRNE